MDYLDQIKRIRKKLSLAAAADPEFRVFGSGSHRYLCNPPLTENEVSAFEKKYNLNLPGCYRAFITCIGNGGNSYLGSGAGPYYGIFPLGAELNQLVDEPELVLSQPSCLYPGITEEEWDEMMAPLENDDMTDEEYEQTMNKAYAGIMPLGSQGCSFIHALVLNGPYSGRVVNIDRQLEKPSFTTHPGFLSWYENWLDDIISGKLVTLKATWFGHNP